MLTIGIILLVLGVIVWAVGYVLPALTVPALHSPG